MKEVVESVRRALRKDPLILGLVGIDVDGETKVYQAMAKLDTDAPYVIIAPAPGAAPISVYGETYAIETFTLQLTAWGRDSKEAWQLSDAIEDAVSISQYDAGIWYFMKGKRITFPQELPDRDTNLVQVPVIYEFQFGKEAQI